MSSSIGTHIWRHIILATGARARGLPGLELSVVDTELVEQHLGALVRVQALDAGDEPGGLVVDKCEQQVVARMGKEGGGGVAVMDRGRVVGLVGGVITV